MKEEENENVSIAIERILSLVNHFEKGDKKSFDVEKLCRLHSVLDFALEYYREFFPKVGVITYSKLRLKFFLQNIGFSEIEKIRKRRMFFDTVSDLYFGTLRIDDVEEGEEAYA